MSKPLCVSCSKFSENIYCDGVKIHGYGCCFEDDCVMDYDTYSWIQECDFYEDSDEAPTCYDYGWDDE